MVRTGHRSAPVPIRQVGYHSLRHPGLPVEVVSRRELLARYGEAFFRSPQRDDFFVVMLTTVGRGVHQVDFAAVALHPGTVVLIRPGQVHRFDWRGDLQADLLVFPPESLAPGAGDRLLPLGNQSGRLTAAAAARLAADIDAIRSEQERYDGSERRATLLRARLEVVLLQVGLATAGSAEAGDRSSAYGAFCELLEARFSTTRRAQDYAGWLGYSRRTLNRVCQQAAGRSAKDLADGRVALEAKRLLIGTDTPVEQIAAQLGFSEATNFGKFFHRLAGVAPGDFRRRHR